MKSREEIEKEKFNNANTALYSTGKFINDAFALADEEDNEDMLKKSHFFQNFQRIKISIGAISKYINDLSRENIQKNVMWLDYKMSVLNLTLSDSLNNMGMKGSLTIHNMGSYADLILHRHNAFYIVINFTIIEDEGKTIKLEPYIFEIANVQNLSAPDEEDRKLKLNLVDVMTSICMNHNIATVIKHTKGLITQRTSYKEVFADILDYIKKHIKVNMLGEYDFRKDLYFTDNMRISSDFRLPDADEGGIAVSENVDMSELITASFAKMPQNATILDAMKILQMDCGRTLKTPKQFAEINQTAGDLIIPFFFREEYQTVIPHYSIVWKEPENESGLTQASSSVSNFGNAAKNFFTGNFSQASADMTEAASHARDFIRNITSQKMMSNNQYGGKESVLLYRNMTMRDIYMPFYLAFADKQNARGSNTEKYIFESMNPEKNDKGELTENELAFNTVRGYRRDVIIEGLQSFPYDVEVVKRKWKNIVFVDVENGTSSVLIFLRWFYNYFCSVFLNNGSVGTSVQYLPNLLPPFLAKSMRNNVGEAEGEGDTFDFLFDSHNSNIFICRTKDSRNEALREMGKNIASLILSNNRYVLKVAGDLFRRPNEIMKFTQFTGGNSYFSPLNSMITGSVNLTGDPYTLLYITDVTHVFEGDGYYNYIEGCKFCENFKYNFDFATELQDNATLDSTKIDSTSMMA